MNLLYHGPTTFVFPAYLGPNLICNCSTLDDMAVVSQRHSYFPRTLVPPVHRRRPQLEVERPLPRAHAVYLGDPPVLAGERARRRGARAGVVGVRVVVGGLRRRPERGGRVDAAVGCLGNTCRNMCGISPAMPPNSVIFITMKHPINICQVSFTNWTRFRGYSYSHKNLTTRVTRLVHVLPNEVGAFCNKFGAI